MRKYLKGELENYFPSLSLRLRAWKEYLTGEPEIRYLKKMVPEDRIAIDIGANNGVYSFWLLKYASQVIAVEPNPNCVRILERALGNRVQIIEGACSDAAGRIHLNIPLMSGSPNPYRGTLVTPVDEAINYNRIAVSMHRLDDLLTNKAVGFIKIDVEGHELEVLKGADATLESHRPRILLEAEERHREGTVAEVTGFFSQRGYTGIFYYNGRNYPIDKFNPDIHQVNCESSGARSRSYANNFFFFPAEDNDLRSELLK